MVHAGILAHCGASFYDAAAILPAKIHPQGSLLVPSLFRTGATRENNVATARSGFSLPRLYGRLVDLAKGAP